VNPALELAAFAGVMALGQFSPGPDMLLLTRTALRDGRAAGVEMACGIACGLVVHSTLAIAGLAVAFQRMPPLRESLRWLAAAYLLWLAWGLLRHTVNEWSSAPAPPSQIPPSKHRPFLRGLFCNLLNPKAALFLAAVSAPFLGPGHPPWWPLAILGIVVIQGGGLWSLWAVVLQWPPLRTRYQRSAKWIDAGFGIALAALAARLIAG
jgi:threonine/homoserine/homoserine lactone efflux protein